VKKHNEISEEQILIQVKIVGSIGRHKYKTSNKNINKKLRKMVKEGKLRIIQNSRDFTYFGLPLGELLNEKKSTRPSK
jgi:hypothetical protein